MKQKGKILLTLLAVALLVCIATVTLAACNKKAAEFEFELLDDGTYSLVRYNGNSPNVIIPDEYEGKAVTSIGRQAFYNHEEVSEITIPDSVESIGSSAFSSCTDIKTATMPALAISYIPQNSLATVTITKGDIGNHAFSFCTGLKTVTIGDGVQSIGQQAFDRCTGLQTLTIGEGVQSIGSSAFSDCTGLTEITIPDSVTSIGNNAFSGCAGLQTVKIGEGVQSIGERAFEGCTGMTKVNVTSLKSWCEIEFGDVSSNPLYAAHDSQEGKAKLYLNDVEIKGDVEIPIGTVKIGDQAFRWLTDITSVTIPDSVESIGVTAFNGCTGLSEITISDSVQSIGRSAFSYCTGLQTVTIGDGVESIGKDAFDGCTGIKTATMPALAISFIPKDSLTTATITKGDIGYRAFGWCYALTSVTIGEGVTSIGDEAFNYCTGLQTVNWNATNCTKAGSQRNYIFDDCTRLATVNFGENVQTIPEYAFSGCTGITKVNVTSLKSWCEIEFGDVSSNPLYMAAGTAKLYLNDELVTEIKDLDGVIEIPNYVFYRLTEITSVTIPDSVTSIGSSAFYGCDSIKELTVPKNVTSVGELAFGGMDNLMSITWDAANCEITTTTSYSTEYGVFYGSAANIASVNRMNGVWVTIGANCENIDDYTFAGLDIDTIFIDSGSSLKSIGEYAFANCHTLRKVPKLTNDVTVADTALYGSTTVMNKLQGLDPSKLHTVGEGLVFYEESKNNFTLVDYNINGIFNVLDLPKQITISRVKYDHYKIGKYAFAYRKDPIVTIPSSVTDIDSTAFYGFSGTKITLDDNMRVEEQDNIVYKFVDDVPSILYVSKDISGDVKILNGVTEIPEDAFSSCKDMKSITIPDSVTSIGQQAFDECTGLKSFEVAEGNSVYQSKDGVLYKKEDKSIYLVPKAIEGAVTILDGCTSIGNGAFSGCRGLTEITIPDSVTSIGEYAFSGCTGLTSVVIPNSVESIGGGAFEDCTGLTSITIPNSVTSIGGFAFKNCTGLTSITIPNSVTNIGMEAFKDCTGLQTVYYKGTSEQWNDMSINDYDNGNDSLINAKRYYFSADDPYEKGTAQEGEEYWHWNEDKTQPVLWVKEN